MSIKDSTNLKTSATPPSSTTPSKLKDKGESGDVQNLHVSLNILELIKDAQSQHGMRHGDFQRYRQYCSRKLQRLRKSLKFPHGDRRRVHYKLVTPEQCKEPRFIHIPVFEAECDWAYSMELKAEANTEPRKKFHQMSKMKKAVAHAEYLEKLCATVGDARTKLESQAYHEFFRGTLLFELEKWAEAGAHLQSAVDIYTKLAAIPAEEEVSAAYRAKAEEIRPQLRYCAYNVGDTSAIEDLREMRLKQTGATDEIDALLAQTRTDQSNICEVNWLGEVILVKTPKLKALISSLDELKLEAKKAETLDAKISIQESLLKRATDGVREASSDPRIQCYVSYTKLEATLQRNMLFVESGPKKPAELARLYESITQTLSDMLSLTQGSPEKQTELTVLLDLYRAHKCYQLAKAHFTAKKLPEASLLLDRCLHYCSQLPDSTPEVAALVQRAETDRYSVRAASLLDDEVQVDEWQNLVQSQQSKKGAPKLAAPLAILPPDFEPIPAKPMFFDLALCHITAPDLSDKIAKPDEKQAGGISGFVKGWLSWGGKK